MKLNFGTTKLTRYRREDEEKFARQLWHPFFTILPRTVADGDTRIFEWIERKGFPMKRNRWLWSYRAKQL